MHLSLSLRRVTTAALTLVAVLTAQAGDVIPQPLHSPAAEATLTAMPEGTITYRHDSPAAMLIRRGKYDNRPDIIRDLGHIWGERLDASGIMSDIDALQAVPMHLLKRLRRGYNQADILARAIGEACDIPVIHAMGARRHSAHHRAAQRRGLNGARHADLAAQHVRFYVTHPDVIAGRHIAIIDDIITTGATLSDAIRTLAPARPRAITILTLAAATL